MKLIVLAVAVMVLITGCGGTHHTKAPTTTTAVMTPTPKVEGVQPKPAAHTTQVVTEQEASAPTVHLNIKVVMHPSKLEALIMITHNGPQMILPQTGSGGKPNGTVEFDSATYPVAGFSLLYRQGMAAPDGSPEYCHRNNIKVYNDQGQEMLTGTIFMNNTCYYRVGLKSIPSVASN